MSFKVERSEEEPPNVKLEVDLPTPEPSENEEESEEPFDFEGRESNWTLHPEKERLRQERERKRTKIFTDPAKMSLRRHSQQESALVSKSVPDLLLRRELGFPKGAYHSRRNEVRIFRGLVKSRSNAEERGGGVGGVTTQSTATKVSLNGQTMKKEVHDGGIKWMYNEPQGTQQQTSLVCDKIMIKDDHNNTRRVFTIQPHVSKHPFKLEYTLPDPSKDKLKWKTFDVWAPSSNVHLDDNRKVLKIPVTFFVLESKKLILYNFNNGNKMDEMELNFPQGPNHYSELVIDSDNDRIYVYAGASAVKEGNPNNIGEILVFQYPLLKLLYRVQFPIKSLRPGVIDVEIMDGIIVLQKNGGVELMNLQQIIELNEPVQAQADVRYPDLKTIVVSEDKVPPVLISIPSVGGYLSVVPKIWPPHLTVKTKTDFHVFNVASFTGAEKEKPIPLYSTPHSTGEGNVMITSYDELSSRIHLSGLLHGEDIVEIRQGRKMASRVIFSTSGYKQNEASPHEQNDDESSQSSAGRRRGLRQIVKRSYADMEKPTQFGMGYDKDSDLDLLAVCSVSDGILYSRLYDYKSLEKWIDLPSIKLVKPKKFKDLGCSDILVHLNERFLSVRLKLYDNNGGPTNVFELYTFNLLAAKAQII